MDLAWLLAQNLQLEFFHDEREPKLDNPQVKTLRWRGHEGTAHQYDFVISDALNLASYHFMASEDHWFLYSKQKISLPMLNKIFDCCSEWNRCLVLDDCLPLKKWCTRKSREEFSIVVGKNSSLPNALKDFSHQYKFSDCTIFSKVKLSQWITNANRAKNIDVKLISLDFDWDRRFTLKNSLEKFYPEIFYGFDAAKVHYRECPKILTENLHAPHSNNVSFATTPAGENFIIPSSIRLNRKPLSRGEFGCAMSHLQLYKTLSTPTIIFEDDASIDNMDMFMQHVRNLPPFELWDICYLQSEATWWPPNQTESINEYFSFSKGSCNRTHAYILTPSGAQKLLAFNNSFKSQIGADDLDVHVVALPSDDLISHAQRAGILRSICPKIRCIGTSGDESRIGSITKAQPGLQIQMKKFGDQWTGIGNQMWQYAVLKILQCKTRGSLYLGSSKITELFPHIKLEKHEEFQEGTELKELREFSPIQEIINPQNLSGAVNIEGYLQHAKYLEGHRDLLNELFAFPKGVQQEAKIFVDEIRSKHKCQVVAVHIRLKDYRNDPTEFLYNIWKPEVLQTVFKPNQYYLIFSNDIEACKAGFSQIFSATNHSYFSGSPQKDMCTMAQCDELIISASSFSWWPAYLTRKQTTIPSPWFNPKRRELRDKDVSGLYLLGWNVVEN